MKIFDGKDIVVNKPLFLPLQVISVFMDFVLDGWTVSWQNGKLDFAPEYLYEISKAA